MARIAFTTNLQRYLACPVQEIPGGSVRIVLDNLFVANPRLRSYILDDQGSLRRHVHIYVNDARIADAKDLADAVSDSDEIFVFQALTGG
ncbi:MAG TPA: MoaD/ThiS family protein [Sphingomicrobium sp.]|jgi:molybdopterin converting factor small subunit